jgi:two-component system chemotaxis response regulator CheB
MALEKIKVLIVDDSIFFRTALKKFFSADPSFEIVGSSGNAYDAEKKISNYNPDVVTLDVEMPGMSGTDFLKKIMPHNPVPIVLVSALNMSVFDALESGAVDFVKKPDTGGQNNFNSFCAELSSKVKIASKAKTRRKKVSGAVSPLSLRPQVTSKYQMIAIGASTGGTEAILSVIKRLPQECPGIVIVQHMPPGFTKMFADRLNHLCEISVSEAKNGDRIQPGRALVAPGDKHMTVEKDMKGYYVKCTEGEKVSGHCPSVDVLFHSVAAKAGKRSLGVILTGMGKDGAAGLLKMKEAGAYTIGQDKDSSVVYGMPKEAYDIDAVIKQASIDRIPNLIIDCLNK